MSSETSFAVTEARIEVDSLFSVFRLLAKYLLVLDVEESLLQLSILVWVLLGNLGFRIDSLLR